MVMTGRSKPITAPAGGNSIGEIQPRRDIIATWNTLKRSDPNFQRLQLRLLSILALLRHGNKMALSELADRAAELTGSQRASIRDMIYRRQEGSPRAGYFSLVKEEDEYKMAISLRGASLLYIAGNLLRPFYFCKAGESHHRFIAGKNSISLPDGTREAIAGCNGFEVADLAFIVFASLQGGINDTQVRFNIYTSGHGRNAEEKQSYIKGRIGTLLESGFILESGEKSPWIKIYSITDKGKRFADAFYHLLC